MSKLPATIAGYSTRLFTISTRSSSCRTLPPCSLAALSIPLTTCFFLSSRSTSTWARRKASTYSSDLESLILPGLIKLCPKIYLPLFTFPKTNGITLSPKRATIECIGLANSMLRSAHFIFLGNGIDNTRSGRIPFKILLVSLPRSILRAHKYEPFSVSMVVRLFTATFTFSANFFAAIVGIPFSSKPTFAGGPVTSVVNGFCLPATSATLTASLLGVPKVLTSPCSIRDSVNLFKSSVESPFRAGSI